MAMALPVRLPSVCSRQFSDPALSHDPKTYRADFIPAEYFGQNHQFIVVGLRELIQKASQLAERCPLTLEVFSEITVYWRSSKSLDRLLATFG